MKVILALLILLAIIVPENSPAYEELPPIQKRYYEVNVAELEQVVRLGVELNTVWNLEGKLERLSMREINQYLFAKIAVYKAEVEATSQFYNILCADCSLNIGDIMVELRAFENEMLKRRGEPACNMIERITVCPNVYNKEYHRQIRLKFALRLMEKYNSLQVRKQQIIKEVQLKIEAEKEELS